MPKWATKNRLCESDKFETTSQKKTMRSIQNLILEKRK